MVVSWGLDVYGVSGDVRVYVVTVVPGFHQGPRVVASWRGMVVVDWVVGGLIWLV